MKIGILSDTHNDRVMVKKAAEIFESLGVTVVIHCGDVTSPLILDELSEFQIFLAYGNMDFDRVTLDQKIAQLGHSNESGKSLHLCLDNKDIFVTHGDIYNLLDEANKSGSYDYVFSGHTHRFRDQKLGRTRDINPGALGGGYVEQRSIAVLDLSSDYLERYFLD